MSDTTVTVASLIADDLIDADAVREPVTLAGLLSRDASLIRQHAMAAYVALQAVQATRTPAAVRDNLTTAAESLRLVLMLTRR